MLYASFMEYYELADTDAPLAFQIDTVKFYKRLKTIPIKTPAQFTIRRRESRLDMIIMVTDPVISN